MGGMKEEAVVSLVCCTTAGHISGCDFMNDTVDMNHVNLSIHVQLPKAGSNEVLIKNKTLSERYKGRVFH